MKIKATERHHYKDGSNIITVEISDTENGFYFRLLINEILYITDKRFIDEDTFEGWTRRKSNFSGPWYIGEYVIFSSTEHPEGKRWVPCKLTYLTENIAVINWMVPVRVSKRRRT